MVSCVVIDDDEETAEVFSEILSLIGVNVMAVGNNGKKAIELYKKHRPDLIFIDLIMPRYDGFYALEHIRKIDPLAKIVIVTGDIKAGESSLLDTYEVNALIYKPFEVNDLKRVLRDIF